MEEGEEALGVKRGRVEEIKGELEHRDLDIEFRVKEFLRLEEGLEGKRKRRGRRVVAVGEYEELEEVVKEKNLDLHGCINGHLIAHDKIGNSLNQGGEMERFE